MRSTRFLRVRSLAATFWLWLAMAAVAVGPLLVQAGAAHEAAHLLNPAHPHASAHAATSHLALEGDAHHAQGHDAHGHRAVDAAAAMEPSTNDDGGDRWHALMHHGHCCGHPTAVVPSGFESAPLPAG